MCSDCKTPGSCSLNGAVNSSFLFVVGLPIEIQKNSYQIPFLLLKDANDISDKVLVVQRVGIDALLFTLIFIAFDALKTFRLRGISNDIEQFIFIYKSDMPEQNSPHLIKH